MNGEQILIFPAGLAFLLAGWLTLNGLGRADQNRWIGASILTGALCVALAIATRWLTYGQGPFLTMYEVLISSLFSLSFVYGLAVLSFPVVRVGAPFAVGALLLLFLWAVNTDPGFKPLPPTYQTPWLWAHVVTGKLFLGCCLVATSLGLWLLFSPQRMQQKLGDGMPRQSIERLVWLWLTIAFLFHSSMLTAGAVWAQDAWGRFWDWDSLETWAFVTWLCMAVSLHSRAVYRIGPRGASLFALATFVLAFLTFFGVPFISINPHQGAV